MRAGIRMLFALGLCGSVGGCDIGGGASDDGNSPPEPPVPTSAVAAAESVPADVDGDTVERGRELFLPCAVCHGLDGRGNQLGPSLRDGQWIHITGTLAEIEGVIRDGVPSPEEYPVPMVPMGGGDFDAEELRAVASYVYAISRSVSPPQAP